jgi:CheY-like chemotaxis protein
MAWNVSQQWAVSSEQLVKPFPIIGTLIRAFGLERLSCSGCSRVVRRRTMTTLADGKLICKDCLNQTISAGIQKAIGNLPGAKEYRAFALEPNDRNAGALCAFCNRELRPLQSVCNIAGKLSHLTCTRLADRLARKTTDVDRPSILLVEDERPIREIVASILASDGFNCCKAEDGAMAMSLLASSARINLVLSNMLLPEVDGWTLFLHVRKHYPNIPFVFVTAIDDSSVRDAATREGAAGFLLKPFDRRELLSVVRNVLEHRKHFVSR